MNLLNIAASIANQQTGRENIQITLDIAFPVNFDELSTETQNAIKTELSAIGKSLDDLTAIELTIQQDEFRKTETPFGVWVHFNNGGDEWGGGFNIPLEVNGDNFKLSALQPVRVTA